MQQGVDELVEAAQEVAAVAPGFHPVAPVPLLEGGQRVTLDRRELQAVAANPIGVDGMGCQAGGVAAGLQAEAEGDVGLNVTARTGGDKGEVGHNIKKPQITQISQILRSQSAKSA